MLQPEKIKTVFFDAGGTLFRPYPSIGEIYARTAHKHGMSSLPDRLEMLFKEAWNSRNGMSSLAGKTTDKIERDWWYSLVKDVFATEGKFADFEAFFAELYDEFARAECWRLFDDAIWTLDTLRRRGYRLGMISNWDHRLFSIVEALGIKDYFVKVTASAVVGVAKPGAAIFHQALEALSAAPEESVHIGDSLSDDYHGARSVGMQAVLLDRHGKPYNGVVRIESLSQLTTLLA